MSFSCVDAYECLIDALEKKGFRASPHARELDDPSETTDEAIRFLHGLVRARPYTKCTSTLPPNRQRNNIERAHALLLEARDLLRAAGAPYSLARVQLAVSSVKGARRIARTRRLWRSE